MAKRCPLGAGEAAPPAQGMHEAGWGGVGLEGIKLLGRHEGLALCRQ